MSPHSRDPVNALIPSRPLIKARRLCALAMIAVTIASPLATADEPTNPQRIPLDEDPFALFASIPNTIDAAAVFNNPADQFLLNDSGKLTRKLFALAGLFTNTEQAFNALGTAFDSPPDEMIQAFLSKRVLVMWDALGESDSVFGLANAMDTNWTLVCEVEPSYLQTIRLHLKPIRRNIEHGQTIYAIEKGRYEIVLLNVDHQINGQLHKKSLVILAPRRGAILLDKVLASIVTKPQDQSALPHASSIIDSRAKLLGSIALKDPDWLAAWIVQLNEFMDSPKAPVFAGMMSISADKVSASFATDLDLDLPELDAPVGLLSAVGGDAILAVVLAKTPSIFIDQNLMGFFHQISVGSQAQADPNASTLYPEGPGLIMLSQIPVNPGQASARSNKAKPLALTVMTQLDQRAPLKESPAVHADRIMHNLFVSFDPSNATSFKGRFPRVIRAHTLRNPARNQAPRPQSSGWDLWPGDHANISWVSTTYANTPVLVTSLAPAFADTTGRVRWVVEAAEKLDSIPNSTPRTGVIFSGYFQPSKVIPLLDSTFPMDMGISKLVDRIDWEISRSPAGLTGSTTIEFVNFSHFPKLGSAHSNELP